MGFDLYNGFLKIWESTETPTLKMGAHLFWMFILTLSHTPKSMRCDSRAPLQALAFVASPRLGLRHLI
jgi:hypothetical protein